MTKSTIMKPYLFFSDLMMFRKKGQVWFILDSILFAWCFKVIQPFLFFNKSNCLLQILILNYIVSGLKNHIATWILSKILYVDKIATQSWNMKHI